MKIRKLFSCVTCNCFIYGLAFCLTSIIRPGTTTYILYAQICYGSFTCRIKCCHGPLLHMVNQQCGHFSGISWPDSASSEHSCRKLPQQHVWGEVTLNKILIVTALIILVNDLWSPHSCPTSPLRSRLSIPITNILGAKHTFKHTIS